MVPVDGRPREDETRFRIEPDASRALLLVRRDGPLARFGHDHALVARPVDGFVIWSDKHPRSGRAAFNIDVRSVEVDPPEARAIFQLDTSPDEDAVKATRSNLLKHVLRANEWPVVQVAVHFLGGDRPNVLARADLVINGRRGHIELPMELHISGNTLIAKGRFDISQQDWGIEPFAVLGGGLRVADEVSIRFEIKASRSWRDKK